MFNELPFKILVRKRKVIKFTCDHYFQSSRCSCSLIFFKWCSQKFRNIYRNCKFIRKRFQHSCFPVNIATFLKTTFSHNTSEGLLKKFIGNLNKERTIGCNFIKKRLWHRCFPVNFTQFLRAPFSENTFWRMPLKSQKVIRNNLKMNVQFITILKDTIWFYASIFFYMSF